MLNNRDNTRKRKYSVLETSNKGRRLSALITQPLTQERSTFTTDSPDEPQQLIEIPLQDFQDMMLKLQEAPAFHLRRKFRTSKTVYDIEIIN